jgi:hypothetical protein
MSPGSPPSCEDGATHIDITGEAYSTRFVRTFGFYEGRAAVSGRRRVVSHPPRRFTTLRVRYAWCGNFQGRALRRARRRGPLPACARDGRCPRTKRRWRYAGDFRDGLAVVQRDDGLHSHIDRGGKLVHRRWFVDLDVFHKGFARARDDAGWMHVDERGAPHTRAGSPVEPFYNGQARVERFDGGLEVINELRATRCSSSERGAAERVRGAVRRPGRILADGQPSLRAVELGLVEALPGTTLELASQLGLNARRLEALLRALAELAVVERHRETWRLTHRGTHLRGDHPLTLADAAREYAGPLRALWGRLRDAMRIADWQPPDVFGDVAADPARVVPHHRMLRSYARHDYPSVPDALGLRGDERVLDVGGGVGVLAEFLLDRHPELQVIVLDRPEVLAQLPVRHGVVGVPEDLFGTWSTRADVAVLARVLHDWDDESAVRILRNVRSALPAEGRVFLIEMLVSDDGFFGGLCDLHLLMATGGRERTADEYGVLLHQAGFELVEVRSLGALPSVMEGVVR